MDVHSHAVSLLTLQRPMLAPVKPAANYGAASLHHVRLSTIKDGDARITLICQVTGNDDAAMPLTQLDFPILQHFLCVVESRTGLPAQPLHATEEQKMRAEEHQTQAGDEDSKPAPLPKGWVLGPDGKPCRSCTSAATWKAMMKQTSATPNKEAATTPPAVATSSLQPPSDCPPDVEELGRSSWTLLHSMTAAYPEQPSLTQQTETKQFLGLFGKMYPCWVCADDFRAWMKDGNEPRVSNREEFGRWACEAHNAVNVKLGKPSFDCNRWEERWRIGWKDGRCD